MKVTPLNYESIIRIEDLEITRVGMVSQANQLLRRLVKDTPGTHDNGTPRDHMKMNLDVYIIDKEGYERIKELLGEGEGEYYDLLKKAWDGEEVAFEDDKFKAPFGAPKTVQQTSDIGLEPLSVVTVRKLLKGVDGPADYETLKKAVLEKGEDTTMSKAILTHLELLQVASPRTFKDVLERSVDQYNAQLPSSQSDTTDSSDGSEENQVGSQQQEPEETSLNGSNVETNTENQQEGNVTDDQNKEAFHVDENLKITNEHTDTSKEPPLPNESDVNSQAPAKKTTTRGRVRKVE